MIHKLLQYCFRALCIIATTCMVIYWFVTFLKNEDVSKIEIKYFKDDKDIKQPEFSMCFQDPFIDHRFKEVNSSLSKEGYHNYLIGNFSDNLIYSGFKWDNVTIDIFDYIKHISFEFRPDFELNSDQCNKINDCQYLTFRNTMNLEWGQFLKCYTAKFKENYSSKIQVVSFHLKHSFSTLLEKRIEAFVNFIYPNQQFLMDEGDFIWRSVKHPWIKLKSIEILRKRNKKMEPCIPMTIKFDEYVLGKHLEKVGCRAPYQENFHNFPLCNTQIKMKESVLNRIRALKNLILPCESISSLSFMTDEQKWMNESESAVLMVNYPEKLKIITQSQAVDFQALIGYIGGYIGLFLGITFALIL